MALWNWSALLLLGAIAEEPSVAAKKLALLVAVADYPEECNRPPAGKLVISDLCGPVNDIMMARDLLVERFGFDPADITILANAEATHQAVVTAFHEKLIERAAADSEVVFWYSGHGSRIPDASGIEPTGYDSTLVLYDSRAVDPDGGYDLSDDELRGLVDRLTARAAKVLVVTDSCHSAGVTRSSSDQACGHSRNVSAGKVALARERIEGFWPTGVTLGDDAVGAAPRRGYVHIAACDSIEEAQEDPLPYPDGRWHGYLTFGLCWFLRNADPETSFRTVAERTANWISPSEPDQSVRYEGEIDRTIFGGDFAPPPRGFAVRLGDGRELVVSAGTLHGVRGRSEFVIETISGREVGRARAAFLGAVETTAMWVAEQPADARDEPLRAVMVEGSGERRPVALAVVTDDPARAASFVAALEVPAGLAEFVAPEMRGVYRLVLPGATEDERVVLIDPTGRELFVHAAGGDGATIAAAIRGELLPILDTERAHQAIYALAEDPGEIRLEVSFDEAAVDMVTPERFALGLEKRSAPVPTYVARVMPGETRSGALGLRITNRDPAAVRVAVLAVDDDRTRTPIYPTPGIDELLPAGTSLPLAVEIPLDDLTKDRPHRQRYIVFATRERIDLEALQNRTPLRGSAPPQVLRRAFGHPSGGAVRGKDEYGIAVIDLVLQPAAAN